VGKHSQAQSQQAASSSAPVQAPQPDLQPSANQKLLAGLNQLKQKRMLKQTMTVPSQQVKKQD